MSLLYWNINSMLTLSCYQRLQLVVSITWCWKAVHFVETSPLVKQLSRIDFTAGAAIISAQSPQEKPPLLVLTKQILLACQRLYVKIKQLRSFPHLF